jgi:hypothetical protein
MCLSRFLCFNQVCGFLHIYSILVDCMFQVDVFISIMFLHQAYVLVRRPCLCVKPMIQFKAMFNSRFLVHFTVYFLFLGVQMALCFYVYVSLFPSIQKLFIQKLLSLFASVYVSCFVLFTCVTFSLVGLLLCFMFGTVFK